MITTQSIDSISSEPHHNNVNKNNNIINTNDTKNTVNGNSKTLSSTIYNDIGGNGSVSGTGVEVCHGRVADVEAMVPSHWWRTVFADGLYLKTDGDVFEDPEITNEEIKLLETDTTLCMIFNHEKKSRVLDLCCGQGRHTLGIAEKYPNLTLYGHDQSAYLISLAQERAVQQKLTNNTIFTVGDCRQIPYENNYFDLVLVMGNSFGYFSSDDGDNHVLEEIHRVLKSADTNHKNSNGYNSDSDIGGRVLLDLPDGGFVKKNFVGRSWEWIDDTCFVCRERQLSKDGKRLSSREVITVTNRGVIRDQFYQERLYSREEIAEMLYNVGFDVVFDGPSSLNGGSNVITTAKDMSKRNEDLGMMERRMFIKAIKNAEKKSQLK